MLVSEQWLAIAAALAACLLIYLLGPVLTPFLVGAGLAYLGDPLVDWLETWRLPRTLAVSVVFFALLLAIFGLVVLLVPLIGAQIEAFRENLPAMLNWAQNSALPWIDYYTGIGLSEQFDLSRIGTTVAEHWKQTSDIITVILHKISSSGLVLLVFVTNLVLIPVVTFYLLRDWDRLIQGVRDLLPRASEPTISALAAECNVVLGAFLRGQLLVMIALGITYVIGLWLLGLKLALLIGTLAGLASIVPYLGAIVGISAALIAAMFQFGDIWHLLGVAAVFAVGQALESILFTPHLIGNRIGLHPVAVIFAILAGGQLFGFVGVLLALPAAAVIMVLLRDAYGRYKDSTLYTDTGPE